ncbi:MAG: IS110 family transposase [Elusimicrobiota bacterium]
MFDRKKDKWEITPLDYDVFIGLDVDKRSTSVTSFDHNGHIDSLKMSSKYEVLINYVRKRFKDKKVAFTYEAGPTGYGLYDKLTEEGYRCLVTNPASVPTASNSRVKTNRIDSVKLAKSLRGGELKSVRVPTNKYRQLRHLTKMYNIEIKSRTACKQRIKALFLLEGEKFPKASRSSWVSKTIENLKIFKCGKEGMRFKLDMLLEEYEFRQEQVLKINRELRRFCREDEEIADSIRYVSSIPGIGKTISVHLIARIGDYRNLKNVRELAGFLGLTPCEHSTGDRINKGNITRMGDKRLRSMLIEGAWSAINKDPELAEFYHRVYSRHPKDRAARKAIVAVARKLTSRIYRVLKDRRNYDIRDIESKSKDLSFNKKRRLNAPKDDPTLRRTVRIAENISV